MVFYIFNELSHLTILLFTYRKFKNISQSWLIGPIVFIIYHIVSLLLTFVYLKWKQGETEKKRLSEVQIPDMARKSSLREPFSVPEFEEHTLTTRDGVRLQYRISKNRGDKIMMMACPLGQCGPSIFNAVTSALGPEYTYITWDYRGFFNSSCPKHVRNISVPEHARDMVEVLEACGYKRADIVIGHSMGVQVILEALCLFPKKIGRAILVNGAHGHVFSTAFQMMVRVPFIGDLVGELVRFLLRNFSALLVVRNFSRLSIASTMPFYNKFWASPLLKKILGEEYLLEFIDQYWGRILEDQTTTESYLRMFQELNAHSVYHLLTTIKTPVLLISGLLDPLTPAVQSFEMDHLLPNSEHYCDPWSSHATLLEHPEPALREIIHFLRKTKVD
jgi:3-oxoadipate enol-lactonase